MAYRVNRRAIKKLNDNQMDADLFTFISQQVNNTAVVVSLNSRLIAEPCIVSADNIL